MKISRKITLTIVLTLLLLLGVGYVGLHYVVGNKFGELERMSVERNRERVRAVVQAELASSPCWGRTGRVGRDLRLHGESRSGLSGGQSQRAHLRDPGVDLVALYDADKQPQAAFCLSWWPAGDADPGPAGASDFIWCATAASKPNAGIWFDGERYYLLAATGS